MHTPSHTLWSSLIGGLLGCSLLVAGSVTQAAQPAKPGVVGAPGRGAKSKFLTAHPLTGQAGAGYCYIDVPHVHDYSPDKPVLYQRVGDNYVFTGDPVPYGYEGDKTVFYGHHPIPVEASALPIASTPTFCFLKGPHYHDFHAPEAPGYKVKDKVVFYVGPIPPEVAQVRPQQEHDLEIEYRPFVAQRPKVIVAPPPEWQGVEYVQPAPQTVVVSAPQPTVVVAPPQPTVVVAPPQPTVIVAPPQPAVIIGVPGPIFFGPGGHGHGWKGGHGHGWKGGRGHGWKGGKGWRH